ncbi:anti-repressor SinI family protein [Cytobacillus firmus]|nr:anti-repressor SinI family protein [Cytobacillus firmus]MEC1894048.1 anti-repressor SinI family protein [Cytobacillus firmus]MED1906173.1 anti-repressor SinI family protein [Cytobacillus firmus]MED1942573.1 anti-repressor SinI family protein [Cytobacillus firmus]MED4450539.1 anti-repressor SinI family protein [Cytobacillus firmus]MED4769215.1 anti-repressor SinI family protein [Cytobacillus firmus]
MVNTKVQSKQLDNDWVQLIIEAKDLGIEKEEITRFLFENKTNEQLSRSS